VAIALMDWAISKKDTSSEFWRIAIATPMQREAMIDAAVSFIKGSQHVHVEGCLHGSQPEVIIAASPMDTDNTGMSRLATSLYFKRCDGTFANLCGKKLDVGKD
jgi:hypothetical protein